MTPPAPTIEQLIDALVDKTWWCAHASSFDIDAATADCKAARSALLAAIRSQVPADLAGLLREHAAAFRAKDDAVAVAMRTGDEGPFNVAHARYAQACRDLYAYTVANLKETP